MLAILPEAFSSKKKRQEEDQQALIEELYKQIGQLKVENEFLKKKRAFNILCQCKPANALRLLSTGIRRRTCAIGAEPTMAPAAAY